CVNLGLRMADFSAATGDELRSFLPREASVGNPVDMIASATAEHYSRAAAAVLDDRQVDMAMVINVTPILANPIDVLEAIGAVARERTKPVLAVMMATEEFYDAVKTARDLPPVYHFPQSAARVMFLLARYAAWRRRPADLAAPEFDTDDEQVTAILDGVADGYLDPAATFRILDLYGVPLVRWRLARDTDEAVAAAGEIGFPVVLKAVATGLVHKSDVGAVQ